MYVQAIIRLNASKMVQDQYLNASYEYTHIGLVIGIEQNLVN